jgi:hypothetical protein
MSIVSSAWDCDFLCTRVMSISTHLYCEDVDAELASLW